MELQRIFSGGEHMADDFIQFFVGDGGGDAGAGGHQVGQRDCADVGDLCRLPVGRYPQVGVDHAGQHGGDGAAGNGGVGMVCAHGIAAEADALAVQSEDVPVIWGLLRDVGDEAAGGVALGHQLIVDGRKDVLRQKVCQNVGHLRTGGHGEQLIVHGVVQHALGLQIRQVRGGGQLSVRLPDGRACLRVAGTVQTADAAGENDGLVHGQRIVQAVGAVRFSDGKAVFVQGRDIAVKRGIGGEVGKLAFVGFGPNEVFRAVFLRTGRNGQTQERRQKQCGDAEFHGASSP